MALDSKGGGTFPDILITIVLLAFSLIAIFFSILVFRHNYTRKRSPTKVIFMILSSVDFLTGVVVSLPIAIMVCMTTESKLSTTTFQKLHGFSGLLLIYYPSYATAVLTFIRFMAIKFLLKTITIPVIMKMLLPCLLYQTIITGVLYFYSGVLYDNINTKILTIVEVDGKVEEIWRSLILTSLAILVQAASLTLSAFILQYLFSNNKEGNKENMQSRYRRKKSLLAAIKILILNFGSILFIIANIAVTVFAESRELFLIKCCDPKEGTCDTEIQRCHIKIPIFVSAAILPSFCSALNPLVYVILTPGSVRMKREDPQRNINYKTTQT